MFKGLYLQKVSIFLTNINALLVHGVFEYLSKLNSLIRYKALVRNYRVCYDNKSLNSVLN